MSKYGFLSLLLLFTLASHVVYAARFKIRTKYAEDGVVELNLGLDQNVGFLKQKLQEQTSIPVDQQRIYAIINYEDEKPDRRFFNDDGQSLKNLVHENYLYMDKKSN